VRHRKVPRRAHVVDFPFDLRQSLVLVRPEPPGLETMQERGVVHRVSAAGIVVRIRRRGETSFGVLAQQLVHVVPAGGGIALQQRQPNEVRKGAQRCPRHLLCRFPRKAAAKHRHPRELFPFFVREALPRRIEHHAHAAVPRFDVAQIRFEEIQAAPNLLQNLRRADDLHPRGGEENGERTSAHGAADRRNRGEVAVAQRERG
jgi:hypothetical protein